MINRIKNRKRLTPFLMVVREFLQASGIAERHELHELKAAKQLFLRRQSRLMPQHAAIIRVIRAIRGQEK
jgi:hypothetical protein